LVAETQALLLDVGRHAERIAAETIEKAGTHALKELLQSVVETLH
jgi:hypothetical protein